MLLLGLETSCDETAVGIVDDNADCARRIHANCVIMQLEEHAPYGGVVPELAAREHLKNLLPTVQAALDEAKISASGLDAVAATRGPGWGAIFTKASKKGSTPKLVRAEAKNTGVTLPFKNASWL